MKDYEALRDEKAEFTEPCFDLGLAYELDRLGKGDSMILIRGASLRAARTASKADYLVFGSAFGFEALAIPLCTGGGPLPGRHCSVLLVVRPGDLLLPDEEEIGTFYRHLDPKTSSKRHEEEAANVMRFFAECAKAELNREGRQWTAAPPSAEILSERLESLAAPIRDVSFQRPCRLVAWAIVVEASTHPFRRRHVLRMLMQKLPDILKEEVAGSGLLAVNAFAWSLEHLDDVFRSYDPLIFENPKMVGLKALRLELLHHAEKAASNRGEAASTVARGVETGIAMGGEEEHEREDVEGGGEHDGGSEEEEEDVEREEDDVVVTGEEEAVQFAGEKVADMGGGSGPKLGKKARGSSGSTPPRMASKAAIERLKAAEREIKKLREEKLVAEKRLEFQTARNDTIYGVVTSAVNKLTTVAEGVTHLEQTSGRSIQLAVDAVRAVVQEAVSYRGSTLEFMNTQWLPTVQALHLTATAAQGRRREDDLLLLRGVADSLGQNIKTVVSAEVKAAMESEAQRIAAAVTAKVVQELRDDLVKAVTSATQQGIGTAGPRPIRRAHTTQPPSCEHVSLADELMGPATAQGARPSGGTAQTADDMHVAAVVGQARREPVAVQHVQPSTSTPTARPTGVTAQLPDDLLRPAAVVGQQGGPAGAGQHLHPSTSTLTAQDARPAGVTALVDELLRPSSGGRTAGRAARYGPAYPHRDEFGDCTGRAFGWRHGAGRRSSCAQHPWSDSMSSRPRRASIRTPRRVLPLARDARPGGVTALVDELLRPAAVVGQHVQQAAGPSGSTVEAAVWRAAEEAGGVDEEILASIVMPDPEIEVMREKLQAAAPTVGAQQGAPAASTAPAEDHSAAGAKSPPATTGEVGDGKQRRKGKDKAKGGPPKVGSSKGTSKAAAQGRKGSGVRVDPSTGLAVSEMKLGKKSRYICRSMDKSEAAYCIAVAVSSFDGFVSDVVLDEFDQCHGGSSGRRRGAAATVRGASNEFASRCRTVIEAVLKRAASREVVVGEVAETVTKDLQAAVLRSLPEVGEEREHDELIARVMIENLAFWGDCNVGGPKLKARGVDLPIDPQMKVIIRDRGARGQQHKGKQVADA
ncbi:unnamed protein product [Closterium sp. NIES-64]|nr:unnamed protein product [Closterium sp. NIES-64]